MAVVRPAPGGRLDTAELVQWARERLAGYKIPKGWVVVEQMPMTAMGKVQKFLLSQRLSPENGLDTSRAAETL